MIGVIYKKYNNDEKFLFEYHLKFCTNYNTHTYQTNNFIYNRNYRDRSLAIN